MAMGWPVRTARAVAGNRSISSTWPTTLASSPSRSALTRQRSLSSCSVKMSQSAAPMVSRRRWASAVRTVSRSCACEATAPSSTMSRSTDVALLQLLHEEGALERSGQRLRGTAQEAQVLGEVPLPSVVEVEQPDELVVDHQRQADLAREAVVVVGGPLVLAQLRVVRAGDDQDLVVEHRLDRRRVALEVERAAQHGLVVSAAVEAGDAAKRAVDHAVDVAVRRVHRAEDPLGDSTHEGREVSGAADEGAQLDELVEDLGCAGPPARTARRSRARGPPPAPVRG